jgi:hypothetical protein
MPTVQQPKPGMQEPRKLPEHGAFTPPRHFPLEQKSVQAPKVSEGQLFPQAPQLLTSELSAVQDPLQPV